MKKINNEKGFLGPIGDDLPSLIPLVFALIIFFGAFGVTFSTFNQRGRDFDLQIEALRISTGLKGNSYFANYEQFREICDGINARGIKFRGGLVEFEKLKKNCSEDPANCFDIFNKDPQFYGSVGKSGEANVFMCENTVEELSRQRIAQQNPITRDFPVALNDNFTVKPMSLVITVWK